jgi:peptide-methionine (R)-S-oxide reductase
MVSGDRRILNVFTFRNVSCMVVARIRSVARYVIREQGRTLQVLLRVISIHPLRIAAMNNPYYDRTATTPLNVSNEEWKRILPPDVFAIARQAATERAFTGKFWDFEGIGTYYCAVCGQPLFRSDAKFASSCGWPSFFQSLTKGATHYHRDTSHGMIRTEVTCGRCGSHLGHVFEDGPRPTGQRYCMNSLVLDFEPDPQG